MAVLLDTALLPRAERREALTEAMYAMTRATRLGLGGGPDGPSGRLEVWGYGPLGFFRAEGRGMAMDRSAAAAAADDEPYLSLAVHLSGCGRSTHLGRDRLLRPGDLAAIDLRAAYAFAWDGEAANLALNVPVAVLGLRRDVVQAGSAHLESSPVHALVRDHLRALAADVDGVTADPQAADAASATLRLVRLLLTTAAQAAGPARDAHDAALPDLARLWAARAAGPVDARRAARALGTGPRYIARRCPGVAGR
ncbi:AraC-like ligand-binding domain-containing protein [Geodermatophilus sp. SYSU D00815]